MWPLLAASVGAQAESASQPSPLKPCRVQGVATEVLCGSIKRPLNPTKPNGRQIHVHFTVLPAMARHKLPDPIILFAGGPGQSGLKLASTMDRLFKRANSTRDLIVFDQRGVGKSLGLSCKLSPRDPLSKSLDAAQAVAEANQCRERLTREHHLSDDDWKQFTTDIAMQDVDAIRAALGVARWNLVGGSYGTRAALEYLRQYPQHVRRVILDGVAPSDMNLPESAALDVPAALELVFGQCDAPAAPSAAVASSSSQPAQSNNACAYPHVRQQWQQVLARLPERVTLTHPVTLQPEAVTITRNGLENAVFGPLYAPVYASALPYAIGQAAQGRYEPLLTLRGAIGGPSLDIATGMHFAVVCSEDWPRGQPSVQGELKFGQTMARNYAQICLNWPKRTLPEGFDRIAPVQVAALVLSGSADPVTPPRHGERVAKALGAKARHVVAPHVGHGVMAVPCMRDQLPRFIQAETDEKALALEFTCATKLPRPTAFIPSGVRVQDLAAPPRPSESAAPPTAVPPPTTRAGGAT